MTGPKKMPALASNKPTADYADLVIAVQGLCVEVIDLRAENAELKTAINVIGQQQQYMTDVAGQLFGELQQFQQSMAGMNPMDILKAGLGGLGGMFGGRKSRTPMIGAAPTQADSSGEEVSA